MRLSQPAIDKSAIGLSLLCVVHCLMFPMVVTVLPVVVAIPLNNALFHQLLLLGVLPTSVFALLLGCRRHNTWGVLAWGIPGLIILISTTMLGHDVLGDLGEKLATIAGSVLVIYGHFKNYKLCKLQKCEC